MSASNREVAYRAFAAEYDDATFSYSESDEERAPNYVVTPTGARVNRLFVVGVLTEVEQVSDDVLRARVADPTGAFVVYAGQYQPDEMAFLEDAEAPMFVAVTGKARTFSPDDSDRVFTSIRPESVNEVDAETRDRWTVRAAEHTLARAGTFAAALDSGLAGEDLRAALADAGADPGVAAGIPVAMDAYGTTEHYLASMRDLAVDALELVAGEADEVPVPGVAPGDEGPGTVDPGALADSVDGAVASLSAPAGGEGASPEAESGIDESGPAAATDAAGESADEVATDTAESGDASDGDEGETDASAADADLGDGDAEAPAADADADDAAAEGAPGDAGGSTDDAGKSATSPAESDAEEDDATAAAAADGDLGDFEPAGDGDDDAPAPTAEDQPDDVLDDEERERLEEEYGTFESGTEVDEPGEADIEPEAGPIEPEEVAEAAPDAGGQAPAADVADEGATAEAESGGAAAGDEAASDAPDEGAEPADEPAGGDDAADVDLEDAVLEAMADLDDGDGAEQEAVVASVVDDHGVDPGAAEEAIQDALMSGKCYEPDDDLVKPI